jgi:23S rRNA (pseudouridine1915-N3)-methyltransferase
MKITILCVGKVKEKYFSDAIAEYGKRLGRYCTLKIIEVADEKTPENAPEAVGQKIKETEGKRLLAKMDTDAFCIALAIDGKQLSSPGLAKYLSEKMVSGTSHLQFVIGGSLGLSEEVLRKADFKLSFSAMTFPHQLMRVILLEQIYRSFRIINHEPYHK